MIVILPVQSKVGQKTSFFFDWHLAHRHVRHEKAVFFRCQLPALPTAWPPTGRYPHDRWPMIRSIKVKYSDKYFGLNSDFGNQMNMAYLVKLLQMATNLAWIVLVVYRCVKHAKHVTPATTIMATAVLKTQVSHGEVVLRDEKHLL